ncbi:MAG: tyrosine-type recombinase/integrase [Planctomycetes bacterium]|nr:tyrosine-type recombinase/integrase [Planctomycetota bacterium]
MTRIPKLCRHKASGRAVVRLNGRDNYCGRWGTDKALSRYHRLIAEWLATEPAVPRHIGGQSCDTVAELCNAYLRHAHSTYRKHGRPTAEIHHLRTAMRRLLAVYADLPVDDFGPRALRNVRRAMLAESPPLARRTINDEIARIKRMFIWGGADELVDPLICHRLACVKGLRRGQGGRDMPRRRPVTWEAVEAVRPLVSRQVWAMIQLQWHTGMRSGSVCIMRPCDLAISGDVWLYTPATHKTEHRQDADLVIAIGPRGQAVLRPWLRFDGDSERYLFQPAEAVAEQIAARRKARTVPLWPSHLRRPHARAPRWRPGDAYTPASYRKAVQRACYALAPAPPPLGRLEDETIKQWRERLTDEQRRQLNDWRRAHRWTPHQIRHTFATRAEAGVDAVSASAALGHAGLDATNIYVHINHARAAEVARKIG